MSQNNSTQTEIESVATVQMEIFSVAVQEFNLPAEIATDLANAVTEKIRERLGGQRIYIPALNFRHKRALVRAIQQEFNGLNASDLCKRFGVSKATLYRMAKFLR